MNAEQKTFFKNVRKSIMPLMAKDYYDELKNKRVTWEQMKKNLLVAVTEIADDILTKPNGAVEEGDKERIVTSLQNDFHAALKKFPRLT